MSGRSIECPASFSGRSSASSGHGVFGDVGQCRLDPGSQCRKIEPKRQIQPNEGVPVAGSELPSERHRPVGWNPQKTGEGGNGANLQGAFKGHASRYAPATGRHAFDGMVGEQIVDPFNWSINRKSNRRNVIRSHVNIPLYKGLSVSLRSLPRTPVGFPWVNVLPAKEHYRKRRTRATCKAAASRVQRAGVRLRGQTPGSDSARERGPRREAAPRPPLGPCHRRPRAVERTALVTVHCGRSRRTTDEPP
jgi:hypothetical protein